LSCVQQGSKILFTTRMESVANLLASVIDKDHESLSLEGLEKQQLRLLFNDYAFRGVKNLDNHRDYEFKKEELIQMWMAAGFIQQQEKRPEDLGEDYLNHLLRKSFFESRGRERNERYVMHDLMHELAQNVSYGECCRVEPNDKLVNIPSSVRHILVHESEIARVSHLENLHSVIITGSRTMHVNPFVLPNKLIKSLRLLKINTKQDRHYQLSEKVG
jgi:hypothetical protein